MDIFDEGSRTENWLAGTGLFLLSAIGIAVLAYIVKSGYIGAAISPIGGLLFSIANYIPFGLMIFGLVADMFAQEFRYSITTIMAIGSIFANKFLSKIFESRYSIPSGMTGGGVFDDLRDKGWCTLPGLEMFESKFTPMSILVTSAIMTYYIIFAWLSRSPSENISITVALPLLWVSQIAVFGISGCTSYYVPIGGGTIGNILISIVIGLLFGGAAVATIYTTFPQYAPFAHTQGTGPGAGGFQAKNPIGSGSSPVTGGACSAVQGGEEDAMVCEAYRNGQLVTESLT
jgi:hypothetical protein